MTKAKDANKAAAEALAEEEEKIKQAETLVRLAHDVFDFFRAEAEGNGRVMAVVRKGPNLAIPLKGDAEGVRQRLAAMYRAEYGAPPSQNALAEAMTVLVGEALDAPGREVFRRVARYGSNIVLDLGDDKGRCVTVGIEGWTVEDRSAVTFVRVRSLTLPLPVPRHRGSLKRLRALVNISDEDWPLAEVWLVHALFPEQSHVIPRLQGEQGTAKTTTARLLVSMIDPSTAVVRSEPRNAKDWAVAASSSWSFVLDNLGWVEPWLSDLLCKAVTGDGHVYRALYTDTEVSVLSLRRTFVVTSIGLNPRGDLAERMLPLETTAPDHRLTEVEVMSRFAAAWPSALGALLDLASEVLALLPQVSTAGLPRMADFAVVCRAVGKVRGMGDDVLDRYTTLLDDLMASVVEGDPLAIAVRQLIEDHSSWSGTASDLLVLLNGRTIMLDKGRGWPRTPQALSSAVRRLAPSLRQVGIEVDFHTEHRKARIITLTRMPSGLARDKEIVAPPAPPAPPKEATESGGAGGAGGGTASLSLAPSKRPARRDSGDE